MTQIMMTHVLAKPSSSLTRPSFTLLQIQKIIIRGELDLQLVGKPNVLSKSNDFKLTNKRHIFGHK